MCVHFSLPLSRNLFRAWPGGAQTGMGSKAQTANGPDCPLAARRCIRKVQERPSLCFSRPRTDFGQARRNAPMQPDHARFGPDGHGRTPSLKEEKGKTRLLQSRCVRSPAAKPSAGHSRVARPSTLNSSPISCSASNFMAAARSGRLACSISAGRPQLMRKCACEV